jgi:hypothetical protein
MESYYNLGIVKMTTGESGRGLILKRELSLDECKYILSEIFGIKLYTREDFDDEEEYIEQNLEYQKVVNKWLKGECSSKNVDYFRIIWDDRKTDIVDLIPILAYLKRRKIID